MIEPGDVVICAVSGGPDSMCLLDTLFMLSRELAISLHVAHLNHHMRGEEADKDAAMVVEFCRARGIPATVGHEEVFRLAEELKTGVEEAGRIARYRFFFSLRDEIGADKIALGHNMNDQAETVIMRLLRGSGTRGLSGIPPVNNGIIRPLIEVPRALTEQYCRERNLPVIKDVYNFDLTYRRNLVRHKILPELSRLFNPSLVETLSGVAEALRWDAEFLEKEAREAFLRDSFREGRITVVDEKAIALLPPAISSRVLEQAWRECAGDGGSLSVDHIKDIMSENGTISLPGGIRATRERGFIAFYPPAPDIEDIQVCVPGCTDVPQLGLKVVTSVVRRDSLPGNLRVCRDVKKGENAPFYILERKAFVDYNKCGRSIHLRTWRPGDRFMPLGMGGRQKKLQDFFVSLKVPRLFRDFVPVFTSGDEVVWVGGYRISERFKVDEGTTDVLEIEVMPYLRYRQNCATISWSDPAGCQIGPSGVSVDREGALD